jgi:ribonuclease J
VRVCIHRGTQQVGGACIEVEHDGARLVLDAGLPLDADFDADQHLPDVPGLADGDDSLVGLVVSHGHPDHYGLVHAVHPSVPIYIGEATQRILREAAFFTPGGAHVAAVGHLFDRTPLALGPFTVTPYLVDHSAFDAYALLVEASGRRLLYSGDLRAHGRKGTLFERLVREPPANVDALLLEGTNIRAAGDAPAPMTERDVEERCVELLRSADGMVLAAYSAQNIDRLVTLYRAAKRSGRLLVLDLYAATTARATGRDTIPQAGWDGVRVFVPLSQRIKVKQSGEFERVSWLRGHRLFPEDLAAHAGELVMTFRGSMAGELERAGCLTGAHAVWSMWHGYLDEPAGVKLRDWLQARDIPLTVLHSSGHASVADLQPLAAAVNAKQVVPVHTWQADRYGELFDNARIHPDGEWWTA